MGDVTGEVVAFDQLRSQAPLDHSRHPQEPDSEDDDSPRDAEDEADHDHHVEVCDGGRSTSGADCEACGDPLGPMGSSATVGFCLNPCPTAADQPPGEADVHEKECLCREVNGDRWRLADELKLDAAI
jgi:hypothetical protein